MTPQGLISAASASDVKQTGGKRRLTTIPPELRLNIYDHYFAGFKLDIKGKNSSVGKKRALVPALFATCKLIRGEALAGYEAQLKTLFDRNEKIMDEKWQPKLEGTQEELIVMMRAGTILLKTFGATKTVYNRELVKFRLERTGAADPSLVKWARKHEGRDGGREYECLEIEDWLGV